MIRNNHLNRRLVLQNYEVLTVLLLDGFNTSDIIIEVMSHIDDICLDNFFKFLLQKLEVFQENLIRILDYTQAEFQTNREKRITESEYKEVTLLIKINRIIGRLVRESSSPQLGHFKQTILMHYFKSKLMERIFEVTSEQQILLFKKYLKSFGFKKDQELILSAFESLLSLISPLLFQSPNCQKLFLQIISQEKLLHLFDTQFFIFKGPILSIIHQIISQDLFYDQNHVALMLFQILIEELSHPPSSAHQELLREEKKLIASKSFFDASSEYQEYVLSIKRKEVHGVLPFLCFLVDKVENESVGKIEMMGIIVKVKEYMNNIYQAYIETHKQDVANIEYSDYFQLFQEHLQRTSTDSYSKQISDQTQALSGIKVLLTRKMIDHSLTFDELIRKKLLDQRREVKEQLEEFFDYLQMELQEVEGLQILAPHREKRLQMINFVGDLEEALFKKKKYFTFHKGY